MMMQEMSISMSMFGGLPISMPHSQNDANQQQNTEQVGSPIAEKSLPLH